MAGARSNDREALGGIRHDPLQGRRGRHPGTRKQTVQNERGSGRRRKEVGAAPDMSTKSREPYIAAPGTQADDVYNGTGKEAFE